jgi:hypothetical protein
MVLFSVLCKTQRLGSIEWDYKMTLNYECLEDEVVLLNVESVVQVN